MFQKLLFERSLVGPQVGGFRVEGTLVVRIACQRQKGKTLKTDSSVNMERSLITSAFTGKKDSDTG